MKKLAKLLLRKETLRTLTEVKLARVVSGADADTVLVGPPTDLKHCLAAAVDATFGKTCPATAIVQ